MILPRDDRGAEMRALFFDTAAELLQALNDDALRLESNPSDIEVVRSIRRGVHTLKGDAAVIGFQELSDLAHELEDVLVAERGSFDGSELSQVVLSAADMFDAMVAAYRGGVEPPNGDPLRALIWKLAQKVTPAAASAASDPRFRWTEYEQTAIADAIGRGLTVCNVAIAFSAGCPMREAGAVMIRRALEDCGEILASVPEEGKWAAADQIEVAVATKETDATLTAKLQVPGVVGDVSVHRLSTETPATASDQARGSEKILRRQRFENMLRVDAARVDSILNLLGEMVIAKSVLQQAINEFSRQHPKDPLRTKFADALAFQSRVLGGLQRAAMEIRMVPVGQLFRRFPRLVRDVAQQCGRNVILECRGEETEFDKTLVDALAEPLSHLLRNAVDHGIEGAAARVAAGKPEAGTVSLNAFHKGNQVVIEVADDGRGIDAKKVLGRALERGLVTVEASARLGTEEILDFIFEPGFSTADEITPVSGRGVGMDVVKAAVQKLKGAISIHTEPGRGTTFRIKVPLTLAIMRAMMFRVRERLYAVPLDSVIELRRVSESEITRAGNREVMQLRDELLTIVRLRRMEGEEGVAGAARLYVLVIDVGARKFGLVVDRMAGEQELVIKPLDAQVIASDLVSGASVLGDGTVALILNVSQVVRRLAVAAPLTTPANERSWGATA